MKIKSLMMMSFAALIFFSCSQGDQLQEANEKIATLEDELAELEEDKNLIRAEYNEVIDVINEIDETLMDIDARERQMENLIGDLSGNELQRELILNRIQVLKDQNVEAQKKANQLQGQINNIDTDNESLQQIIKQYEQKLKEKDAEIAAYEVKLNQIEAQLKFTESELATQYAVVEKQKDSLIVVSNQLQENLEELQKKDAFIADCVKAWWVAGTKKALRQAGILKKGGVTLKDDYTAKMVRDYPINFYKTTEIDCKGPIQEILPERASNTYEIQGPKLVVKDPESFWQTREVIIVLK